VTLLIDFGNERIADDVELDVPDFQHEAGWFRPAP